MGSKRENILKTIKFESPEYIPMEFVINDACWQSYPQEILFDLIESHKFLFPNYKRLQGKYVPEFALVARKGFPYTDDWGCIWETTEDGITGTVTKHPLEDWFDFKDYKSPDPNKCMGIGSVNWENVKNDIKIQRENGEFTIGGLRHGHTFLQLCDIRGYENLIFDMADEEPDLMNLINMIEVFNLAVVEKYLNAGVDMLTYPEDLGMQHGPMISPEHFRKYIKPSYMRLMKLAHERDVFVHMHSDGYLHELIDDIIECGVDVINLQDLVNGIDWIAQRLAGKVCIELDIDRQDVTFKGTPEQIDSLIFEEVKKIGSKEGGLMMIFGLYPGVPIENVKAVMDAMEKYAFFYS